MAIFFIVHIVFQEGTLSENGCGILKDNKSHLIIASLNNAVDEVARKIHLICHEVVVLVLLGKTSVVLIATG